ncbi:MAG: DinB family protein [Bryobacter sp.]|nr:DinB family protein [Bryobacter sp.]
MDFSNLYSYLVRARLDLMAALQAVPEAALNEPLLRGKRFQCIKDLLFHIADVEDGTLQGDIQGLPMLQQEISALWNIPAGGSFAEVPLALLLDYWQEVQVSTESFLSALTASEANRVVAVADPEPRKLTVQQLLWVVAIHEIRHTAQICLLLRQAGYEPPALDLLFYLPKVSA